MRDAQQNSGISTRSFFLHFKLSVLERAVKDASGCELDFFLALLSGQLEALWTRNVTEVAFFPPQ